MDLATLTTFFMWCTIFNVGLFMFWVIIYRGIPDFVYRAQRWWCPISRETFNILMYAFFGVYKIFVLVFVVIPYVALLIIS